MDNKYFLGLDIGTDSVGFAATDENYNVIKKGKKEIIGARLFESGNAADERRVFRSIRRRTQRNKDRVVYLRSLLEQEISKLDNEFFQRLDESKYHHDDKKIDQYNSVFNDEEYTDLQYHKDYPTIYHLRKALINAEVSDVRLLYLGLAHIIKSRGHFLFPNASFGTITDFSNAYNGLITVLGDDEYKEQFYFEINNLERLEEILKDKNNGIQKREKLIYMILNEKPTPLHKSLIKLILGGKVELGKIFEGVDEEYAKKSICFKGDFDSIYSEIESVLDQKIIIIDVLKAIYDWSVLVDILKCDKEENGSTTISDALIYKYELHKSELKLLKQFVKENIPDEFDEIFKAANLKTNYPAYVGKSMKNGRKLVVENSVCSQEDFCKYLSSKIKDCEDISPEYEEIIAKISAGTLLPKQRTKDNAVMPYQVHKTELDLILKNNAEKFSFLKYEEDGLSVSEKIEKIFLYKIPYYVGPLNPHSKFSWVVKNCDEKILPWNFERVVNEEQSAEEFIKRMMNKCTYIKDAYVLPKKSIMYSKFSVLNELNNLKLNGDEISIEVKKAIFKDLFERQSKVTQKQLKAYLFKCGFADKDVAITGIDGDFKNSMESYIKMKTLLGDSYDETLAEDVIRWATLFSEGGQMIKNKIESQYAYLDKALINKLSKFKASGWGRLSKELLELLGVNKKTGEVMSIIEAMEQTNCNLMQLLSGDYTYIDEINKQQTSKDDITIEDVRNLYCSPAVKKSIWQTVKIVKEIEKVMGAKPEKLFIEVTRSEGEKKATTSRKRDLLSKYNFLKKEYESIYNELEGKNDSDLRQKKLYLYFTQLGRCAYTGRSIDLNDLSNNNIYDIEHIYPRSKTKDDSIHNNLVLVHKVENNKKQDKYPVPKEYRQESLWKLWYDKKLINKTKFERLMRTTEFEPKELEGFIARQLVETSQSSKAVATLFQDYYEDTNSKVVYVKAGNVSDFRHHFKIAKVREINDYHHAHDAYLNIVVGNVWDVKFTKNFFKNISNQKFNLKPEKLYEYDVKSGDNYAWKVGNSASIKTVKDTIDRAKIIVTRQAFEASGRFYKETVLKKGSGEIAMKNPLNSSEQEFKLTNLEKYGGYGSIYGAYFCVVEHIQKKKQVRSIEYVPIYLANQIENNPELLSKYLVESLGLVEPKIILRKLKIGSLMNVDGFLMCLSGRTGNQLLFRGAVQLKLSRDKVDYFKRLVKISERMKINPDTKVVSIDMITKEDNLLCYELILKKLENTIYNIKLKSQIKTLENQKEIFEVLEVEKQCVFLVNALTLFKCNASLADLSLIKGPKSAGVLVLNKNIKNCQKVTLIHQSITGIYQHEIDLLNLGKEK